ncbi:hypothetical protein [Bradyrhizobium yuanmingense]|uniref:Uncharacterized protein n=1 Tax=Bradyrhizobium yuanmingense TaxID=108015 RepID=A0ABV4GCZ8_9BRAD|nr:hypothetical protein [Bradyrhizobium yuanmingense]
MPAMIGMTIGDTNQNATSQFCDLRKFAKCFILRRISCVRQLLTTDPYDLPGHGEWMVGKAGIKRGAAKVGRAKRTKTPGASSITNAKAKRFKRPNSLTLSDLFLWISVVDECQYRPHGALERAQIVEGFPTSGNLSQRLSELESKFGKLFFDRSIVGRRDKRPASRRHRSAVPSLRGAALAEIFVLIEHLYRWATTIGGWPEKEYQDLKEVKQAVMSMLNWPPLRTLERTTGMDRIGRSIAWRSRLQKRKRSDSPGKFSDLKPMRPEPEYKPSDLAEAALERRRQKRPRRETLKKAIV